MFCSGSRQWLDTRASCIYYSLGDYVPDRRLYSLRPGSNV